MFTSKSKTELTEKNGAGNTTIGSGTEIRGDINCQGDIRVDGVLKGNILGNARIVIGPDGVVEGDITGQHSDILGKVTGTVKVSDLLNLRGHCVITGDIYAGKLQVEPTATFNGHCHMGGNVVEMNREKENTAAL
jgi:cytoskeletal protein CcmA (bactofilin family)